MRKDEAQDPSSLAVWLRLQKSLAEKNNISLVTLTRDSAAVGRIENDNSICQSMRISEEHAQLCAADCARAYSRAVDEGRTIHYRCHAGLHCFASPVQVDKEQIVVLGGRAFTSTSEYSQFLNRYSELDEVRTGQSLKNIKFTHPRDLRDSAELVTSTAQCHFQSARLAPAPRPVEGVKNGQSNHNSQLDVSEQSDELEIRNRSIARFYDFLRTVASTLDSQKIYPAMLAKLGEIMSTGRTSLMILDERSNELVLEATIGANIDSPIPVRIKPGESVAGIVIENGSPLLVRYADTDARVPFAGRFSYKTKSFISFPIMLGPRKVGVINLTERLDGAPYSEDDLSLLDLMAPHLALIVDRTEWHRKAETYQMMSLTDSLTGLPNRRFFEERLFEEVERSKRYDTPLSFLLIDIDHFKHYNDVYGHTNADTVLVKVAQILRRSVRTIDMPARFAGDEFCLVLPETDISAAGRIAERVRRTVSETEFFSESGAAMDSATLSIGVSSFSPSRQSPLAIIETADRALYKAKTLGRNQVVVYEEAITV
jgi:diguanylate cyclase (GGDEF)-like protein